MKNKNTINIDLKVDKFKTFLKESGAVLLDETNEFEAVRFRTENGVSVVYKSRRGYTFTGESREAFDNFQKGNIWEILGRNKKRKKKVRNQLIERDGYHCFYCGIDTFKADNFTVEHVLSIAHGGNNNINNLVVACDPCNKLAADLPIIEKMAIRETNLRKEIDELKQGVENGKKK